jgi:hypothetical protein
MTMSLVGMAKSIQALKKLDYYHHRYYYYDRFVEFLRPLVGFFHLRKSNE